MIGQACQALSRRRRARRLKAHSPAATDRPGGHAARINQGSLGGSDREGPRQGQWLRPNPTQSSCAGAQPLRSAKTRCASPSRYHPSHAGCPKRQKSQDLPDRPRGCQRELLSKIPSTDTLKFSITSSMGWPIWAWTMAPSTTKASKRPTDTASPSKTLSNTEDMSCLC